MPVEPGLIWSSAAEMKICSSSVLPIPSMILTPVASWNACHTDAGSVSPADTGRRSPRSWLALPAASMARYAVGAVETTVTPRAAMWSGR